VLTVNLKTLALDAGAPPMCSVCHSGIVLICAKIHACLVDQPEQRGENHLMAGNSIFHKRFGHSFPWHDFKDVLRPCQKCRDVLLDESQPWECSVHSFASHPFHLKFVIKAPDDFPFA
jgi:hypothetical protein